MRRALVLLSLLLATSEARAWFAVFPGAVEGLGQAPAVFSSTAYLSNTSPLDAVVSFELIPYAGRPAPPKATRTLAPGEMLVVERVLATLFGLTADAGTLRVYSDRPLVGSLVTANVANPDSTYGVALSPVTDRLLLRDGDTGHAPWVSQGGGYRTNVAAVLVDPDSSVIVSVYDAAGTLAGRRTFSSSVPVSVQLPVTDLIGQRDLAVGRVEYFFTGGRGTGYVAVNDDVTGDAIAVQALRPLSSDQLLDGVAKTGGANGTFWRTDARVFNPFDHPISVTVDPLGLPAAQGLVLTVPAHSILDLPDVLSRFGVSPPAAGALRFHAADPFVVFGRTQNVDPTGQRPGTFAASQAAVPVSTGLVGAGRTGVLGGAEQSSRVRSNLAFLATEMGATGTLTLRLAGGQAVATVPFALQPNEWRQKSVADWFPGVTFTGAVRVDVVVTAGLVDGYLSRIDNSTGDPVIVGSVAATETASDVGVTAFSQSPDPIPTSSGGSLNVSLRNYGPDSTEGPLELTVNTDVAENGSKLVVTKLSGPNASDWTLVSGTFGVSQNVRIRRKSFLAAGDTTQVQLSVGVAGGGLIGGAFPDNRATSSVRSDPVDSNNSRALSIDMTP